MKSLVPYLAIVLLGFYSCEPKEDPEIKTSFFKASLKLEGKYIEFNQQNSQAEKRPGNGNKTLYRFEAFNREELDISLIDPPKPGVFYLDTAYNTNSNSPYPEIEIRSQIFPFTNGASVILGRIYVHDVQESPVYLHASFEGLAVARRYQNGVYSYDTLTVSEGNVIIKF